MTSSIKKENISFVEEKKVTIITDIESVNFNRM